VKKLIAGLFSIGLVLLVVVGPLWLAEKLEGVETSRSGLIPFTQVIENSTTTTKYTPYFDLNINNIANMTDPSWTGSGAIISAVNGPSTHYMIEDSNMIFNYNGFTHKLLTTSQDGVDRISIHYFLSAEELLTNNVKNINIMINCPVGFTIQTYFLNCGSSMSEDSNYRLLDYPTDNTNELSGLRFFNWTLSDSDLNNGAIEQAGAPYKVMRLNIYTDNLNSGNSIEFSVIFNTDYYTTTTTTYDNETVTIYTPFISSFTPYKVHKIMMGLGGILIIIMGLIASPLPVMEWADGFLPINQHQGKRSRRRRRK